MATRWAISRRHAETFDRRVRRADGRRGASCTARPSSGTASPCLLRAQHGLGAVGDLQLRADVGHVVLHRLQRHGKPLGDLGVAAAVREQRQHLALTLGELWERRGGRASGREETGEPPGDRRAEDRLAVGGAADRTQHLRLRRAP